MANWWEEAPAASPQSRPDGAWWESSPAIPQTDRPQAAQGSYNETHTAQGLSGINEGIANVLGFPVDAVQGLLRLGAHGINTVAGTDFQLPENAFGGSQTFKDMMGPAIRPESDDPTLRFTRRVGEELGAALVPGAGLASKAARPIQSLTTQTGVALGSGAGAAAAQAIDPNNPYLEIAGQILGGGGVAGTARGVQKTITPNPMSPQRAASVETLRREGVDLTAGQATGNKGLQYAESELGGGAAAAFTERQAEQFTAAALNRAGIAANRATPEVMDRAFTSIGAQFDDLATRNSLMPDPQMGRDLGTVVREYNELVPESQRAPAVNNILSDIARHIQTGPVPGAAGRNALAVGNAPGQISGEAYSALRSRLDRMARSAKADPQLSEALFGIRNALDDAMERSIAANNPADADLWRQVRSDYRNILVIEQAASRAGEQAASGLLTPANLRSAVAAQNKRAYVRGKGDFADLARAGAEIMTPLPQSGTAPRQAVRALGTGIPSLLGAGVGSSGGPLGAMAGAAVGAAVPYAAGRAILSGPGRSYLSNQAWTAPLELGQAATGPSLSALSQLLQEERAQSGGPNISLLRLLGTN